MTTTVYHIRKRVIIPRRGNQFYRDRTDYTRFSLTMCGAPVTGYDVTWRERVGAWVHNETGETFVPCENCKLTRECGDTRHTEVRT